MYFDYEIHNSEAKVLTERQKAFRLLAGGQAASLGRGDHMSATLAVRRNLQDYAGWRKVYEELESDGPAAASDPDQHPPDLPETTMVNPARIPASDPVSIEPQRLPGGQNLRDVAVQLRLILNSSRRCRRVLLSAAQATAAPA
jgi:hypothetical protein